MRLPRMQADPVSDQWIVIAKSHLVALLERAAAGEDPQLLYVELYANSEHEEV